MAIMTLLPNLQLVDQHITDFDDVVVTRTAINRHGGCLDGGDLGLHVLIAMRDIHGMPGRTQMPHFYESSQRARISVSENTGA
jgi:hypothetical protein